MKFLARIGWNILALVGVVAIIYMSVSAVIRIMEPERIPPDSRESASIAVEGGGQIRKESYLDRGNGWFDKERRKYFFYYENPETGHDEDINVSYIAESAELEQARAVRTDRHVEFVIEDSHHWRDPRTAIWESYSARDSWDLFRKLGWRNEYHLEEGDGWWKTLIPAVKCHHIRFEPALHEMEIRCTGDNETQSKVNVQYTRPDFGTNWVITSIDGKEVFQSIALWPRNIHVTLAVYRVPLPEDLELSGWPDPAFPKPEWPKIGLPDKLAERVGIFQDVFSTKEYIVLGRHERAGMSWYLSYGWLDENQRPVFFIRNMGNMHLHAQSFDQWIIFEQWALPDAGWEAAYVRLTKPSLSDSAIE